METNSKTVTVSLLEMTFNEQEVIALHDIILEAYVADRYGKTHERVRLSLLRAVIDYLTNNPRS